MANSPSDQLEEGEIIDDDDDFEAISDNSITESAFGKFVTPNENLRALSLSSDSDSERIKRLRHKRKSIHRKCKLRPRKHKRLRATSESSDSDFSPPHHLKGKLKEAIKISDGEEIRKNTLEMRLKGMGGLAVSSEPVLQGKIEENVDKADDVELENLRMEALKTAVLNKCQRRKRKKMEAQEINTPENKENNTPKDEGDQINTKAVINDPVNDVEEDEDILRASLLAGLAKNITKKTVPNESNPTIKQTSQPLPVVLPKQKPPISKFQTKIINKKVVKNTLIQRVNMPKPQVKPLIINVNSDSDSEEDAESKLPPKLILANNVNPIQKLTDLKAISNNVEKFLKEQRAKFETETKKQTQKSQALLETPAVKLLPKSQQIEYQLLLKKLRNAEKKRKAKNAKTNTDGKDTNSVEVQVQKTVVSVETVSKESAPKVEVVTPVVEKKNEEIQTSESKLENSSEARKSAITNELTTLQKTLKEIKMQKNGSLQIKSKYQVLTPIIRKITSTSNDRKKQEHRIKVLLQELKEARSNLAKSHERFSALVKELVLKKETIDTRLAEKPVEINAKRCQEQKKSVQNGICRENKSEIVAKKEVSLPVTSTPIKDSILEEPVVSSFVTSSTNNDCEDMDVCNSDETDICQIDIVDPNDIDQIFKRKPTFKSTIPEYVSPLNFNVHERYNNVDPLGIMCPYEINGSCRDVDCTYKHYLKNHER